jgi:hypothetical protein
VKHEEHDNQTTRRESSTQQRLLARVRARTESEHSLSLSTDTPHYAAAALGQTPYVALPNCGVIIVQKKGGWGC